MQRSTPARWALALFSLLLCAAGIVAVVDSLVEGENHLIQRDYAAAVSSLEKAVAEADRATGERARAMLLLGRARLLGGDAPGAVRTFQRLLDEESESPLVHMATFQKADALSRQGEDRQAAVLYRDEIARLIGLERKEDIGATYLSLGEKARAADPQDHQRAVVFFDLALDLGLSTDKARTVRLLAAESLAKSGNHALAAARLEPLVAELPAGKGTKERAMLLLGRSWRLMGQGASARGVLRDLRELAPESTEAGDAAYEIALSYGVPTPSASYLDQAVGALDELRTGHPEHPKASMALFLAAQCQAHVGRSDESLATLRSFVEASVPGDAEGVGALAAARAMIGDLLMGQGRLEQAIAAWRAYLSAHPSHSDWERVQRAIVDAQFAHAMAPLDEGDAGFAAARERLAQFQTDYPLDSRNPHIAYVLADMLARDGSWEAAVQGFARCVSKYPGKNAAAQAQLRIGMIYESELYRFDDALKAYRKVASVGGGGDAARRAESRVLQLEAKSLSLRTPRVFNTGEDAHFEIRSRNIESLRVRVFRLDLEDYFRATHTAGNIEQLDIEVIAPDATLDSAVPDYQKFKETDRKIPLGFREPGAYVVKIDDRELEATTMVLVSDVAMIAKSSRHEVFVFTQNTAVGRVEAGVRVLLSDGSKILAEGVTDDSGVWRYTGDALRQHDRLGVFCVSSDGSGASTLQLSGLGYSVGLTPKGYLFTERSAYQPGERVHFKGMVREVIGGLYRVPEASGPGEGEGAGYTVQVLAADGRVVLQDDVEFTPFGTLSGELQIASDAPLGSWRVMVRRKGAAGGGANSRASEDSVFVGYFEVARYERPRMELTVEPREPVVFRGEPVAGRLQLSYFYGDPVMGKAVECTLALPGGATLRREGKTNAAGEFAFEFPTLDFPEEGVAQVIAAVVGENVRAATVVPVVTTEFSVSASTVRDVYLAGEAVPVTVSVASRAGDPLARQGEVVLLHLIKGPTGSVSEVEQARLAFTSGANGEGAVSLHPPEGGSYRIRIEAVDRFDNLVTAVRDLTVSGANDEVKLRLLSDRDAAAVGDQLELKVANRAGARLVLETVQGDGILAYRTFVLAEGESILTLPLQPLHAPNFSLALTMIDQGALHTAERSFLVARDLTVSITPSSNEVEPGAEVELDVLVTDPEGNPVVAEVALSVVDKALLALYPDRQESVGQFFYGDTRETEFRTVSSCTWSYRGRARAMSEAILAEETRKLMERAPIQAGEDLNGAFLSRLLTAADPRQAGPRGPTTGGPSGPASGGPAGPTTPGPAGQAGVRSFGRGIHLAESVQSEAKSAERWGNLDEVQSMSLAGRAAAFQSDQWNTAIGLGGATQGYLYDFGLGVVTGRATNAPREAMGSTAGLWVAAVVTDESGKARVTLSMPDATTGWRVRGYGITANTYVGQGDASLRTTLDLQVDLVGPTLLTEGDQAQYAARVHNTSGRDLDVAVAHSSGEPVQRDLAAGVEHDEAFTVDATKAGELSLTADVRADGLGDAVERVVGVQPFGTEALAGAVGSTSQDARVTVALPAGREYSNLAMTVEVGPDPAGDLLSAVLGTRYRSLHCRTVERTYLGLAARGGMALEVLRSLERGRGVTPAEREQLEGIVRGALSTLLAAQEQSGGVGFSKSGHVDLRTSAVSLRFFALAADWGLLGAKTGVEKAGEFALRAMRRLSVEQRANLLWALAVAGRATFEDLNSLHRSRAKLSLADAARLALAWQAAGRPETSDEVLRIVRERIDAASDGAALDAETLALCAQALFARSAAAGGSAGNRVALRAAERLRALRQGAAWPTLTATAAAVAALLRAPAVTPQGGVGAGVIRVSVNGKAVGAMEAPMTAQRVLVVPIAQIDPAGTVVEIAVEGGVVAHFVATMTGFSEGFREQDRNRDVMDVSRKYLADFVRSGGRILQPGYSAVTGTIRGFDNLVTKLRVGETARARTHFHVRDEQDRSRISPVVLEEPIPAGCSVPRSSITGRFERVDVEPHRLVFYYGQGTTSDTVHYDLQARFVGQYNVLPTRAYGALDPDLLAYGAPGALQILARGEGEADPYRLSPDELLGLAKLSFDAGDLEAAREHLQQLLAEWHGDEVQLRPEPYKDVARMMLFASIAAGDSPQVVRFFEQLKDRFADLVIPFDKILEVGKAYLDIGEFESALLVFRATAEASFLKDAAVATTLEQKGEIRRSVDFMRSLLLDYPDLNTMRMSLYGVAQQLAQLAAEQRPDVPINPAVGAAVELRAQALAALREFLVFFPEDPLAEEVSFAWATTLLEGENLQGALAVAEAARKRYPGSVFEDEFLYTSGYALFALGKHDEAFAALAKVANGEFARPGGGRAESENRFHAIYLQGQIHHARGEPGKALVAYGKVKGRFSDAGEAADYFLRKDLSLPEVSTVPLADAVDLELEFRNVSSADVQVFKVDLMRLYLLEKSLNDIRGIQLHGIKPLVQRTVELGDGRDYRSKTVSVPLDLAEPGAYLVVARGDDQLASGMVLRTDLVIDAQEDAGIGQVRVNVKRKGAFLGEAHVKVVGSQDGVFRSGDTDLRGVFRAEGLVGRATVIASVGGEYAFYRGDVIHQPGQFRPVPSPTKGAPSDPQRQQREGREFDALDNNLRLNFSNRARQVEWLKDEVQGKQQKGVEVFRTK